jgi:hypothetical protein
MRFQTCCIICLLLAGGGLLDAQSTGSHRVIVRVVRSDDNRSEQYNLDSAQSYTLNQAQNNPNSIRLHYNTALRKISISITEGKQTIGEALDAEIIDSIWDDLKGDHHSRMVRQTGMTEKENNILKSIDQSIYYRKEKTITCTITEND